MTPVKVFLICVFVASLTLCVAAFFAASPHLYNVGAVIAVTSVVTAMWCTAATDLNPKEDN